MSEKFRTWPCSNCGFIYDEAKGLPDEGIAAGTRWGAFHDEFAFPACGVAKSTFAMEEL